MRSVLAGLLFGTISLATTQSDLDKLRDRQDRAALERTATQLEADAQKKANDPNGWYLAATARSFLAEVTYELHDKPASERAAEAGVKDAEKAVELNGRSSDYHRILGTLCGQVIPANPLFGAISYGKRAKESLEKALELDPKSAKALVAHGVGFYYLPTNFGGGPENAMNDYRKAIALDPKNAEAYLWLGIAYAKEHNTAKAREAFTKAQTLDPDRLWTKQQLAKLPAK